MESQYAFTGNSDIFGPRVRVGVYLQLFTFIFAKNIYEPAIEATRDANTTFQITMFSWSQRNLASIPKLLKASSLCFSA